MCHQSLQRNSSLLATAVLAFFASLAAGCSAQDPVEQIRELHEQGKYSASLDPLRELLQVRGNDPEIQFLYGTALRRDGQPDMALWALKKASEHPNWKITAGVELASAASAVQNWSLAIEAASAALSVDPDNLQALSIRGAARIESKVDLRAGLEDLDHALALTPDDLPLQTLRIAALLNLEEIEEAGKAIAILEEKGRDASFDNAVLGHFCITHAVFESETGKLDQAEELFSNCLDKYPTHSTVLDQAVGFFDSRGESERATQFLTAALERTPENPFYRTALSYRLRALDDFEGSEKNLRAGLTIGSKADIAGLWASLADHYVADDDLDSAAAAYEQAFALFPDPSAMQILTLADIHARAEQNAKALEIAKLLENDIYRGLIEARVHLNEGRPARALARLDEVLPDWPDNPGARYYAARAAEQVGDFTRAIAEYRQSIRSNAAFTEAGLRLARIHRAEGALGPAWIAASHHRKAHPGDLASTLFLLELAHRKSAGAQFLSFTSSLRGSPDWALAVSARADAVARDSGAEAAIALIQSADDIEANDPEDAAALRSLVRHLLAAERSDTAASIIEGAIAAHPESADFHEIQGMLRAHRGDPPDSVQASLERALEIDAKHARALAGLANLAAESGNIDEALSLYQRSNDAYPHDPAPLHQALSVAARSNRDEAYSELLETLLREYPHDSAAALQLAELLLGRGADSSRALELARRARRFGGDPEATQLLARIHRSRGDEVNARKALAKFDGKKPESVNEATP